MADRVDQVVAAVPVAAARLLDDPDAACGRALPTPRLLPRSPHQAPFAARTRAPRRAPLRNAARAAGAWSSSIR